MEHNKPYTIVIGNEKGGTGKSTISMHMIVYLLRLGYKVGSVDVDARQGTLTRYFANRQKLMKTTNKDLPTPQHVALHKSDLKDADEADAKDRSQMEKALKELAGNDVIVFDTPGNDTLLSREAHARADTLITPLNDSFVDLDVLVKVEDIQKKQITPSHYAVTVWEQKKQRLIRDKVSMDWIVLRNRLSTLHAKNKQQMSRMLEIIAKRLGFRVLGGLSERVIFRELFLKGLTLLDLKDIGVSLSLSHIAARQELRVLMEMINLPLLQQKLSEDKAA